MSNISRACDDLLLTLTDTLRTEQDPLQRLIDIKRVEKAARLQLRAIKRAAAYEASLQFTRNDIITAARIDRQDLKYLIDCYCDDNGMPSPARRPKRDLSRYMDLSSS
jgi:hypothetical protein